MRQKILLISVIAALLLAGYAAYLFKTHHHGAEDEFLDSIDGAAAEEHKRPINSEYGEIINMASWRYNEADNVYYQLGILYVQRPEDEKYERMALFVPAEFMKCRANGPQTFGCEPNEAGKVGGYTVKTAPIVIPVETAKYEANPALTAYRNVSAHTKAGHIYVHVGFRGSEHGAPAGLVDIKAAIRYLRHNQEHIPANTDYIVMFGAEAGGGLASLVGTTADSPLFRPYFKDIGALERGNERIYGVMAWSPLTNFDAANEAYEWNMGATRSGLSDNQLKLSQKMAREYATYINNAGFRDMHGRPLILQYSERGVYQEGTYYQFVKETIEDSLNEFLQTSKYPLQIDENTVPPFMKNYTGFYIDKERYLRRLNDKLSWIKYDIDGSRYVIRSVEDFVHLMKQATKPLGAFDSPDRSRPENMLFGNGDGRGNHFDKFVAKILKDSSLGREYATDLKKQDALGSSVQDRLNMYTPLYFIMPSFDGYRTAKTAPYWRIRSGINRPDTALTTEINLALALANYPTVSKVDFKILWSQGKAMAEEHSQDGEAAFIRWVDTIMKDSHGFNLEQ